MSIELDVENLLFPELCGCVLERIELSEKVFVNFIRIGSWEDSANFYAPPPNVPSPFQHS